jgi:hypothetical protein
MDALNVRRVGEPRSLLLGSGCGKALLRSIEVAGGREFALTFESGVSNAYYASADDVWDWYLRGFGPLRALHHNLDAVGRVALKRDVEAYHDITGSRQGFTFDGNT